MTGRLVGRPIPNPNCIVNEWLVDGGVAQTGGTSFTLYNIQASHRVQVTFVYVQPRIVSSFQMLDSELQLTLTGLLSGHTVILEGSTDLTTWIPLQTNTVIGSTLTFTNNIKPVIDIQFFRAYLQ